MIILIKSVIVVVECQCGHRLLFDGNRLENVQQCTCGTWYNTNGVDIYVNPEKEESYNYVFRDNE